ncbi:MAG: glycosyltransferase family 4 protein [Desulfovibrio sp.]|nr:glycosyltransferase family 4 protein [Desulfovibrio sp.]
MKIMLLSNQSRSMAVFWRVLILRLVERGAEAICCVPGGDNASEARLREYGARVINYRLDRKGLNPLRDAGSFFELRRIFASERPDALFATTIKPIIYGCQAAWLAGVPKIYATITGLGYAFEADSFFKKIINHVSRMLYRTSLKHAQGIFFQNRDDSRLFREQGILSDSAPVLYAAGTGVDTKHFAQMPLPPDSGSITFLLIGRLLEAKGIAEYAQAAAILKKKWPNARFQLLGPRETGPGSLNPSELEQWESIEYLGETADVRPFLGQAHVVVLPSWREGLPTALLEAMSAGRALVATDVPGCRDVVEDGENGFLAAVKNPSSLAAAMERFLLNPDLIGQMGEKGRSIATGKFDARVVADSILARLGMEAEA